MKYEVEVLVFECVRIFQCPVHRIQQIYSHSIPSEQINHTSSHALHSLILNDEKKKNDKTSKGDGENSTIMLKLSLTQLFSLLQYYAFRV